MSRPIRLDLWSRPT